MRRLVVLGAGIYQMPLIKKAREMGLHVIAVSPNGNYPGLRIADQHLPLDTTDTEGILSFLKTIPVDGVATTGTDVCIPTLGRIVDELDLHGPNAKTALLASNKLLMQERFKKFGVPSARYFVTRDPEDMKRQAERMGTPLIVKPVDSSGSRGVTRIDSVQDIPNAFLLAAANSRSKTVILEEFLEGSEFGGQAIVVGGKMQMCLLHNDKVTEPPNFTPYGHSMPYSGSASVILDAEMAAAKSINALGITDAVCNLDFMHTPTGIKVLEIGARMGGTCIPEIIEASTNLDMYACVINLALGASPSMAIAKHQAAAAEVLRSDVTGTLTQITFSRETLNHPMILSVALDIEPGSTVKKFSVGPDRIGQVVATGRTAKDAEDYCALISRSMRLSVR